MSGATITFAEPTTRTNGSPLATTDIVSLTLYRTDGAGSPVAVATISGTPTPTSVTDPGPLVAGTQYGYQMSATTAEGEGPKGDVFPFTISPPKALPSAPTITGVTAA